MIEAINNGVDFYLQKGGDPWGQFAELGAQDPENRKAEEGGGRTLESENRLSTIFQASSIHQLITEFFTVRIVYIKNRFLKDLKISRGDWGGERPWTRSAYSSNSSVSPR